MLETSYYFDKERFREYVTDLSNSYSYRELQDFVDGKICGSTFFKWTQSVSPSIENFFMFCAAFDVSPDLFFSKEIIGGPVVDATQLELFDKPVKVR